MGRYKPKTKSKEREVMEAIQNGRDPEALAKQYPKGMVLRLFALHEVSLDPDHRDFIKAQMLVQATLAACKGGNELDLAADARQVARIEVYEGRVDIPMPGVGDEEKESGPGG